jgi:predicted ATPase
MHIAPGTRLGKYIIDTELGSGGMGVVYRARDPRLERLVAIKLLPRDRLQDARAKRRFLQEARAASALDHPNICTIHEIDETDDGRLYLVMACYEGETLAARIGRGPLSIGDTVEIAAQIARGLSRSHAAGIVHRDIKPANLIVTRDGLVKILDFGVAQLGGLETGGATDGAGGAVGTLAYMSPEQAMGRPVDARTDLWALGVVLYEMASGARPFGGDNLFVLADAIRHGTHTPLAGAAATLNPVVDRALQKDPGNRYDTADALADELSRVRTSSTPTVESTPAPASPKGDVSSSGGPRSNIPRHLPSLIGRAPLVARVIADVERYALVTLAGFGGIGKTRLAQQVGTEVQVAFRDGVWFVDLSVLAGDEALLPTVARVVGVREHPSEPLAITLEAALRDRRMLLILDNCEQLVEAVASLVEQLSTAAPDVKVLATSREPLGVYGERVCRVDGLSEEAAMALFDERAAQTQSGAPTDREAVRELCRRLDYLPLAIELAAARVRSMTPSEILARLDERLGMLKATDRRSARHRTLEAMIEWSYGLLPDAEQRLFRRLSIFVGSFDLPSAERVCGDQTLPSGDIVDLLDRLVNKSLVSTAVSSGGTRHRLMESVREFGARRLELSGEVEAVADRHGAYFTRQAQTLADRMHGADLRRASTALGFEIDNVDAAIDRLGRAGRHTEKSRLVNALALYWMTGAPSAGRRRLEELIAVIDQLTPAERVSTLVQSAEVYSHQGFAARATALLERAYQTATTLGVELSPYYYYVRGTVAELDNRPDDVMRVCTEGIAVAARAGDDFIGMALRTRIWTSVAKFTPHDALEHAKVTLEHAKTLGLDLFVAVAHMLLGMHHVFEGRPTDADVEFVRSTELAGNVLPQVSIAAMAGSAAGHRRDDVAKSIRDAREALALEERADIMPAFRVLAGDIIAWHWARSSRGDDAVVVLAAGDELRSRLGFGGVWWGEEIHQDAWAEARRVTARDRMDALVAKGRALSVVDYRRLLST